VQTEVLGGAGKEFIMSFPPVMTRPTPRLRRSEIDFITPLRGRRGFICNPLMQALSGKLLPAFLPLNECTWMFVETFNPRPAPPPWELGSQEKACLF